MTSIEKEIQNHISKREFAPAEDKLRILTQDSPDSADTEYLLGSLFYFKGQLGKAIEHLNRALNLDPRHTDASICLSVLYNDIGRYQDAKKVFELANQSVAYKKTGNDLAVDKKFSIKHLEIADMYFRYKRYDEAIEEYSKAILLDPSNSETRIRRAKAFSKKGFVTRAVQELKQLISEYPKYLTARIQLGLLHYSQGNLLDAEIEWEEVLKTDPNHREAKAYLEMAKDARHGNA